MQHCHDCMSGTCMADGYCQCDSGFTGHADFLTQNFSDWGGGVLCCPTSVVVVKVVWGIPIPMLLVVWYSCGVALYDQIKVHQERQRKGQAGRWFLSLPLLTMGSFALVVCPSTLGLCLCKVLASEAWMVIGATPLPSIMLVTVRLGVSVALPCHFHNAAKLALKGGGDTEELRVVFFSFVVVVWVIHVILAIAALTPLMQLARPPTDVDFNAILFDVFFAVPVGAFFLLSMCSLVIRHKLEKIFKRMLERHLELNSIGKGKSSGKQSIDQSATQRGIDLSSRPESRCSATPSFSFARNSEKQRKKSEEQMDEYVLKLKRTRAKAFAAQTTIARQTGLLSLLYLLFLVVPYLKHHGTYLVAFHLQMYNIVGFKLTRLYMKSDPTWGLARRIRSCFCPSHAAVAPESSVTPFAESPGPGAESPRPEAESPRPPRPGLESPRPGAESPRFGVDYPVLAAEDHRRIEPGGNS